jgi:hypothetical protein
MGLDSLRQAKNRESFDYGKFNQEVVEVLSNEAKLTQLGLLFTMLISGIANNKADYYTVGKNQLRTSLLFTFNAGSSKEYVSGKSFDELVEELLKFTAPAAPSEVETGLAKSTS